MDIKLARDAHVESCVCNGLDPYTEVVKIDPRMLRAVARESDLPSWSVETFMKKVMESGMFEPVESPSGEFWFQLKRNQENDEVILKARE